MAQDLHLQKLIQEKTNDAAAIHPTLSPIKAFSGKVNGWWEAMQISGLGLSKRFMMVLEVEIQDEMQLEKESVIFATRRAKPVILTNVSGSVTYVNAINMIVRHTLGCYNPSYPTTSLAQYLNRFHRVTTQIRGKGSDISSGGSLE